jgi:hypothetical protein
MIRIGTADDLAQLVALEVASFDYDRLSARSLRNFLNH